MRTIALAVSTLVVASALVGCSQVSSCASYVDYSDPADMGRDASFVVVGTQTVALTASDGRVTHDVQVEKVVKPDEDGRIVPGITIQVTAPIDACGSSPYPEGDPLAIDGDAEFFITQLPGARFQSMSPYAGAVAIPADGTLPWKPQP